ERAEAGAKPFQRARVATVPDAVQLEEEHGTAADDFGTREPVALAGRVHEHSHLAGEPVTPVFDAVAFGQVFTDERELGPELGPELRRHLWPALRRVREPATPPVLPEAAGPFPFGQKRHQARHGGAGRLIGREPGLQVEVALTHLGTSPRRVLS